jgi:hypothetical protein
MNETTNRLETIQVLQKTIADYEAQKSFLEIALSEQNKQLRRYTKGLPIMRSLLSALVKDNKYLSKKWARRLQEFNDDNY